MSADNSPNYRLGQLDGAADCQRVGQCPKLEPIGPTPPNPAYPVMYNRGYSEEWARAIHHICTDKCQK